MANRNPDQRGLKRTAGPGRAKGSKNKLTREMVENELRILALTNTAALGFDLSKIQERGPDGQPIIGRNGRPVMRRVFSLKEVHEMPDAVQRCIASIKVRRENLTAGDGTQDETVEVRWWDKVKALELCGRVLGMFKDKIELTAPEELISRLDRAKQRARNDGDAK